MRLQSLNCPNCGSPLRTSGDTQICESCGSTFKIDYDDSDVAYERLSKEDELNRQRYQHEKDMLETEYRLREEARQRQANGAGTRTRTGKVMALVILIVVAISFIGVFSVMRNILLDSYRSNRESNSTTAGKTGETTTETTVSPYLISADDLLADSEFIDNATAAVLTEAHLERDGQVITTYDLPVTDWYLIEGPEIYDCYLLVSEKENRLCFLIKMTYQSERDEDDSREVYDCLYLRNIKAGSDGKIACNYAVGSDRGDGATDWIWDAALDSDQLYRSAILGKSDFSREKFALPLLETSATEDADGTSVESAETETGDDSKNEAEED